MTANAAALANDPYAVYLVRHAEKDLSNPAEKDPQLTHCGVERARRLAIILKDIDLQAIYSTDFDRTRSTATPTAESKKLTVRIYDADKLDDVLQQLHGAEQDALVVGHSDTTSRLAGSLAGMDLADIDDDKYDQLYEVVSFNGHAKLQRLHQAFECAE